MVIWKCSSPWVAESGAWAASAATANRANDPARDMHPPFAIVVVLGAWIPQLANTGSVRQPGAGVATKAPLGARAASGADDQ